VGPEVWGQESAEAGLSSATNCAIVEPSKQFYDNMLRSVRGAGLEKITVDNIKLWMWYEHQDFNFFTLFSLLL
jgi:hypothetical protein